MAATISGSGTSTLINLTTSGNTVLGDASTDTLNVGNGGLVKDASGNVGIGVTPSAWSLIKALELPSGVYLGSYTGSATPNLYLGANNYFNGTNFIYSGSYAATRYDQTAGVHSWFNAASGTAGNAITFTERMRIDSSGNLLVGTTSAGGKITASTASQTAIYANTTAGTSAAIYSYVGYASSTATPALRCVKYDNNSTTSQVFVQFAINQDGANNGQINANGASTAAFGSYSDARLKENIVDLPSQLDSIMALRPVEFDYIGVEDGHQIGFIAQEMQQVYPDAVSIGNDEMLMITAWAKTEARLVKAIQELKALVDTQASTITALQADVAALKGTA